MAALFLSACAATAPRTEGGRVRIELAQLNSIPAAARDVSGGAPMNYGVRVTNQMGETITLRRVEIRTVSEGGPYIIENTAHPFEIQIPAGEAREVQVWAPAHLTGGTVGGANSPVSLRLHLQFDSPVGAFQETVIRQAHAARTAGGD